MGTWQSISPTLTPDGAFAALADLPHAAELKPAPLAANQKHFENAQAFLCFAQMSTAMQLGVAGMVDLATAYKSWTLTYDAVLFTETQASPPLGGLVFGTRWGAGFRLNIHMWDVTSKLDLSLPWVAAGVELGLLRTSFEIEGIGFSDRNLFKLLPGPGRFDFDAYKRVLDATEAIKAYLGSNTDNLTPLPLQVLIGAPQLPSPIANARAILYAAKMIERHVPFSEAWSAASGGGIEKEVLRSTYKQFVKDFTPDKAPTESDAGRAERWLDFKPV